MNEWVGGWVGGWVSEIGTLHSLYFILMMWHNDN